MHYKDMDFYGTVIESKEYNVIQKYFHKNDCLSPKIIGHMTYVYANLNLGHMAH